MQSSMLKTIVEDFGNGGTIDGDLVITGDLQVSGGGSLSFDEIIEGTQVIDVNSTEAFLVRKNGDGGDIFTVNTTNSIVDINGTLDVSGDVTLSGTNTLLVSNGSAGSPRYAFSNSATTGLFLPSSNALGIATNGVQRINISDAGLVGIGETASKTLTISSANAQLHIKESDAGTNLKNWLFNAEGGVLYYQTLTDAIGGGSTYMQVNRTEATTTSVSFPTGNIGIGTASPSVMLNLESATSTAITAENTGNSAVALNLDANRSGADQGLGNINFKWNGTTVAQISGASGADTTNKDDGQIQFSTSSGGSSSVNMTLDKDGKLGIGISPVFNSLHIHKSNSDYNYLHITNTTTGTTHDDGLLFGFESDENAYIVNRENTALNFFTNNAQRMQISATGNVGIGVTPEATNSLASALQLGGNAYWLSTKAQGASGETDFGHNFYWAADGNYKYISTDEATQFRQGSGNFYFRTAPSGTADAAITFTERMRITQAGNVGIGDTDPSEAKLSVKNASGAISGIKIEQDQGYYGLEIDQDGNNAGIYLDSEATTNSSIYIPQPANTSGSVLMVDGADSLTTGRIAYFGSNSSDTGTRNLVEIVNDHASATGTTALKVQQDSTGYGLNVAGKMIVAVDANSVTAGVIRNTHATGYGLKINGASDSSRYALTVNDNDDDTVFMRVLGNGKTGIGTSAPGNTLHVSDGSSTVSNNDQGITITDADNGKLIFEDSGEGTNDKLMMLNHYDESLKIQSINDAQDDWVNYQIATFQRDGKVGFGTLYPDNNVSIEDSGDTIVNIDSYSDTTSNAPVFKFRKSHNDTTGTITETTDGHFLGFLGFEGVNSSSTFSRGAAIFATQNGASGSSSVPAKLTFQANSSSGASTAMILDHNSRISLSNNDSGTGNTVFGNIAADDLTNNAEYNSFYGYNSGHAVTTGDYNVGFGMNTIDGATNPQRVVAIGSAACRGNLTSNAQGTVAVGYAAANVLTTGQANTAVGYETLTSNTTGEYNTAIGYLSLRTNVDGDHNTALGYASLYSFEAGSDGEGNNVAIGSNASFHLDTGQYNTMVGTSAGQSSAGTITYTGNTGLGYKSLFAITTGGYNIAIGNSAGDGVTTGSSNVLIGSLAGDGISDAGHIIAIGDSAARLGTVTTAANGTVAVGSYALGALTSGAGNTAVGYASMQNGGTINTSTAIGYATLQNSVSGMTGNTAIGYGVLDSANNSNADDNTGVGKEALGVLSSGAQNVAVGKDAGNIIQAGNNNVCIGKGANPNAHGGANQIVLGKDATGVADNSVTLGNSDVTAVYMAQDKGATTYSGGQVVQGVGNETMWKVVSNTMAQDVEWDTGIDTSQSFMAFVGVIESDNTNGDTAIIACASGTISTVATNQGYIVVNSSTVAANRYGFYSTSNTLRVKTTFANGVDVTIAVMSAT